MTRTRLVRSGAVLLIGLAATWPTTSTWAAHQSLSTGAFAVQHQLTLPGTPVEIYDAVTGDVSGWWDHTFSESPAQLFIQARPGGGFLEIFDDSGDGVRHATVIAARRGEFLRFEGPLGFSGKAMHMVHTYELAPVGADSTRLVLTVRAAGEMEAGWATAVDGVWRHFLFERLLPYVESGRHLEDDE